MASRISYLINRSPHGGMSVNHKEYTSGQFLPGRRVYAQGRFWDEEPDLPHSLDHDHLKSLDLHNAEPAWNKGSKEGRNAYGGVIFNDHGQVLMVEPTNHFLGYAWTFPKGGNDPGEHPVDTALRETKEESGHDTSILGIIPKRFPGQSGRGFNHYFVMRSHGQTSEPHWETASTRWAHPEEAHKMIEETDNPKGKERDHAVLDAAVNHLKQLKLNPDTNNHLKPQTTRKLYEKHDCGGHCGCKKCNSADAIVYSRDKQEPIDANSIRGKTGRYLDERNTKKAYSRGKRVTSGYDQTERIGRSPKTLEVDPGQSQDSGIYLASQGHTHSLISGSPVQTVASHISGKRVSYSRVLKSVRMKNSIKATL